MAQSTLRALVTGGRGFIGSFLVEDLLRRGFEVSCLLRRSSKGKGWLEGQEIKVCEGDISIPASLEGAVQNADYVFHVAGVTKARTKGEFLQSNLEGTKNVLAATKKQAPNLKRFVHVSSLAAAGPSQEQTPVRESQPPRPVSDYGRSKWRAEQAVLDYQQHFPVSIVRPPAVFGPRDRDVFQIFKYVAQGWLPLVGGQPRYVSLIYVKDLVHGLIQAATEDRAKGETYFLAEQRPYSWNEFGKIVAQVMGGQLREIHIPLAFVFGVSCLGELYSRLLRRATLLNLDKYQEIKPTHWTCDTTKAKEELGFEPEYELTDAIQETVSWYRKHGWL